MSKPGIVAFRVILIALVAGSPAHAQSSTVDSATAAATTKLMALVRKDYLYVAQHSDPAQLRRTRLAIDSLLRRDSTHLIAGTLFDADSAAQLRAWSDEHISAALVRFWVATSGNIRYAAIQRLETPGGVAAGRDTVLVVYRFVYRDNYEGPYSVERMTRCATGWCSELPANVSAILAMMRMK